MRVCKRALTIQQISHFFHVDFHVRDLDCEFHIARGGHDAVKDLADDTGDDTFGFFITDVGTLK
jgi:hypothetical protein